MNRIVPHTAQNTHKDLPTWLRPGQIVQASQGELDQRVGFQKTAAANAPQEIVVSMICPKCQKVYGADSPELVKQAAQAKREGNNPVFHCLECDTVLVNNRIIKRAAGEHDIRHSDGQESLKDLTKEASGTYNTFVDRRLADRAVDELARYASRKGMTLARAKYVRSEHTTIAGQDYPTLNTISCEIEWTISKQHKLVVGASISIDPAGKFIFPRLFKMADGTEHEFEKDIIRSMEKKALEVHMPEYHGKKSDQPTFKRPDITRFRSTASLKANADQELADELVEAAKKKVAPEGIAVTAVLEVESAAPAPGVMNPPSLQPLQTPGMPTQFQQGQSVVNALDGKTYQVKSSDPAVGTTLIDPTTQQEMMVGKEHMQNLKPEVKTSAFPPSSRNRMVRVASMSQTWNDIRKGLQTDSQAHPVVPKEVPIEKESRQTRAVRELGFNPQKPDKDKTGHDKATGIPFAEDKDIVIGLTEFPKDQKRDDSTGPPLENEKGYRIPFKKMDENQVELRERFVNEEKLPGYTKRRDEDKSYKPTPAKQNLGLNVEEEQALRKELSLDPDQSLTKESQIRFDSAPDAQFDPRELAAGVQVELEHTDDRELAKSIAKDHLKEVSNYYTKLKQVEGPSKTAASAEDGPFAEATSPIPERPIEHKVLKTTPKMKEFQEPEVIEPSQGQLKEAVTKLFKVKEEITRLEGEMQKALAPIQETMQRTQEPFTKGIQDQKKQFTSYLEMVFKALGDAKDRIATYEDKIFARLERQVESGSKASLGEVLAEANKIAPELASAIEKLQALVESKKLQTVIERILFEYPISDTHRKQHRVRTALGDEGLIDEVLNTLAEFLDMIGIVNRKLEMAVAQGG